MKQKLLTLLMALLATTSLFADEVTFDFSAQGYTNAQDFDGKTTDLGSGISITWSKGTGSTTPKYYNTGTAMRLYSSNTATFTSANPITSIVFTYSASGNTGTISASTGQYNLNDVTGTWTGKADSIVVTNTATSGQARLVKVVVTYANSGAATAPTMTAGGIFTAKPYDVVITNKEAGATIYYTTDGTEPTTSSNSFTGDSKTLQIDADATIKAMAVIEGKSNSSVTTATYTYEASIANTEATAYTALEARALIDAGSAQLKTTEVYVKGTISKVQSFNANYGSITYWLDGDTLEVYSGLNKGGEKFLAITDLTVGDEVCVKGLLTKYNTTYEFAVNSQVVSRKTTSTQVTPVFKATYQSQLAPDAADTYDIEYDGDGTIYCGTSDEEVAEVELDGKTITVTALKEGTVTITLTAGETAKYYEAKITYTLTVKAPAGGLETLTNGSFEDWNSATEPTGWKSATSASSATLAQSTDAHSGQYSVCVKNASSNKRLGSKEFILPAGWYTTQCYIKAATDTVACQARLGYVPFDNTTGKLSTNYQYAEYTDTLSTTEWTLTSLTFELKEETQINLVVMNPKSDTKTGKHYGDILVDDFVLRAATEEEIVATGIQTLEAPQAATEGKIIVGGQLHIIKGGKTYTPSGVQVK